MPTTVLKPPGIPVFPRHADPDSDCVLARLLAREPWRREARWDEGFAGGIAHRLDVSTSGAVWVADTPEELRAMRAAFAQGALTKTYRFVARKDVPWAHNRVDRPLAHAKGRKNRMVVQRGRNTPHRGKWYPATTRFERVHERLWTAIIETGVMHQIRAHAAFVGLALVGDRHYGGGQTPSWAPAGARFLLHHVGLEGAGWATDPVPLPDWAEPPY